MKTAKTGPGARPATGQDCSCGDCTVEDLPVSAFEALRVSQGMLLGVEDFRVMLGNPRGKHMLHQSWLHGSGVVWGLGVQRHGHYGLTVSPGLAVDGHGREVVLTASQELDVKDWLPGHDPDYGGEGCGTRTIRACLSAEFDCRTAQPVPVLADPCDVTRGSDAPSRVMETARLVLRPGPCAPCRTPYHRVRVLVGLEPAGKDDDAGREGTAARAEVLSLPAAERPAAMLRHLRCLAAADAADLHPAVDENCDSSAPFPEPESAAPIALACVTIEVRDDNGCTTVERVCVDDCCRCVLLPTQTIQELLAGMATCLTDTPRRHDGGREPDSGEGPRVIADEVRWERHGTRLVVPVTKHVAEGSLHQGITVTTLSATGWSAADLGTVSYDPYRHHIVAGLTDPVEGVVRVVVRGTGPTPVFGTEPPAPLAGVLGGPPAGPDGGRDAVITFTRPLEEGEAS